MSLSIRSIVGSVLLALGTSAAMAAVPSVPSQPVSGPTPMPDAPLTPGGVNGNGGLIVSVWDATLGVSLTSYLGLNFNDMLPGATNATPNAGLVLDFGALTGFSSVFGDSDAANIKYTVTAADYLQDSGQTLGKQLITTLASGPGNTLNSSVVGAVSAARSFIAGALNGVGGCAGQNPCTAATSADGSYAGMAAWADRYNGQLPVSAAASVGTGMGFYLLSVSSTNNFAKATAQQYGNDAGFATWLLDAAGRLTYSLDAVSTNPDPVPLPAGLWLLLSGLTGVGIVGRRRKANDAAAA